MSFLTQLVPLFVTIPLIFGIILVFVRHALISWIIISIIMLIMLFLSIYVLLNFNFKPIPYYFGNFIAPYGIEYKLNSLNLFFLIIIYFVSALTIIWSKYVVSLRIKDMNINIYYAIFLICISGFSGILITNDAFNLFIFLEISALSTYILISLGRENEAAFSAFNYLLIGSVASVLYILGIGFLYALFGTLNIDGILIANAQLKTYNPLIYLAYIFITVAILIKIGLLPLGFWLPKAYTKAPDSVAIFLSGVSSNVGAYMLIKLVIIMLGLNHNAPFMLLSKFIILISLLSMFAGGIMCLKQSNIRMLLGYSSISQMGFIVLGLFLGNNLGTIASLFMLFTHALTKVGLFICISHISYSFGTNNINALRGVAKKIPFQYIILVFLSLSLIGIPGTAGFWGKFYLILASLTSTKNLYMAILLAIIVSIASILTFYYSWRIIYKLWTNNNEIKVLDCKYKIPKYLIGLLLIIVVINIITTIYPTPILLIIDKVVYFTFIQV